MSIYAQGSKGEKVIDLMAKTFKALCSQASWEKLSKGPNLQEEINDGDVKVNDPPKKESIGVRMETINPTLHYNIQIHLPETRDVSVYDAIFESLKKHLM